MVFFRMILVLHAYLMPIMGLIAGQTLPESSRASDRLKDRKWAAVSWVAFGGLISFIAFIVSYIVEEVTDLRQKPGSIKA